MTDLRRFVRSPATDEALDGVLDALAQHGFVAPHKRADLNRSALADALVRAAIDHELRIRIDQKGRPSVRGQLLGGADA